MGRARSQEPPGARNRGGRGEGRGDRTSPPPPPPLHSQTHRPLYHLCLLPRGPCAIFRHIGAPGGRALRRKGPTIVGAEEFKFSELANFQWAESRFSFHVFDSNDSRQVQKWRQTFLVFEKLHATSFANNRAVDHNY